MKHRGILRETAGLLGAGVLGVAPACLGLLLLTGAPPFAAEANAPLSASAAHSRPAATDQPLSAGALPAAPLQISADIHTEARHALAQMPTADLEQTLQRIQAAFRLQLAAADLRPALALIDYARLAEAELARRGAPLPADTGTAAEMLRLYELVL